MSANACVRRRLGMSRRAVMCALDVISVGPGSAYATPYVCCHEHTILLLMIPCHLLSYREAAQQLYSMINHLEDNSTRNVSLKEDPRPVHSFFLLLYPLHLSLQLIYFRASFFSGIDLTSL